MWDVHTPQNPDVIQFGGSKHQFGCARDTALDTALKYLDTDCRSLSTTTKYGLSFCIPCYSHTLYPYIHFVLRWGYAVFTWQCVFSGLTSMLYLKLVNNTESAAFRIWVIALFSWPVYLFTMLSPHSFSIMLQSMQSYYKDATWVY